MVVVLLAMAEGTCGRDGRCVGVLYVGWARQSAALWSGRLSDQAGTEGADDWRVRIATAPGSGDEASE